MSAAFGDRCATMRVDRPHGREAEARRVSQSEPTRSSQWTRETSSPSASAIPSMSCDSPSVPSFPRRTELRPTRVAQPRGRRAISNPKLIQKAVGAGLVELRRRLPRCQHGLRGCGRLCGAHFGEHLSGVGFAGGLGGY